MICEIIVSKTVCRIFLIFCRSSSINNFMVKNKFSEPKIHRKLKILRPINFYKISVHYLEGLTCTINMEGFFFRKENFIKDLEFSSRLQKPLIWAPFFSTKTEFYTSFQGWLFNFNVILKTCFKIFLEKLWKNGDFK